MNKTTALKKLKSLGTAQNRKVYGRHGVTDRMYGVSYANLGKLKKEIKTDHALAVSLWVSGNHDARILSMMIGDPQKMDGKTIDAWVKDLNNYVLTDAFSGFVGKTPHARKRMEKWIKSKNEWVGRAGYLIMVNLALLDENLDENLDEKYLEAQMKTIEREIHSRKNRVRDAMNSALIAIGMRSPGLQKLALASAKKIGKVDVDHGETGCKTPDAARYMKQATAKRGFTSSRKSR